MSDRRSEERRREAEAIAMAVPAWTKHGPAGKGGAGRCEDACLKCRAEKWAEKWRRVIAVDLDGTLAEYDGWKGEEHIGEPIAPMVERVKQWLAEGHDVRIFTARASRVSAIPAIARWCREHIGDVLEVTNVKQHDVNEFWDDRAVQVERNTGRVLGVEP